MLAGTGFDSVELLEITLSTGVTVHVADVPDVIAGQAYEWGIVDPGEIAFSQGAASDGMRFPMAWQKADGR